MSIFWEKTVKVVSASEPPPPNPCLLPAAADPRVVTPAYYYNFVEFVSSAKCAFFRSKKNKKLQHLMFCFCLLLLPHFFTYFLIQTL